MRIENQAGAGDLRVFIYRNSDRVQSVALASFALENRAEVEWSPPDKGSFALTVYEQARMHHVLASASFVAGDAELCLKRNDAGEIRIDTLQDRIA